MKYLQAKSKPNKSERKQIKSIRRSRQHRHEQPNEA